jgi:hypothetical protein
MRSRSPVSSRFLGQPRASSYPFEETISPVSESGHPATFTVVRRQ